jgi:hypothetical protein
VLAGCLVVVALALVVAAVIDIALHFGGRT